jgi:cell division protein FtsB
VLEILSNYSGLLNLALLFIIVPAYRFFKKMTKDIESLQRQNQDLQREFTAQIRELKENNALLKEEISLLRMMLFKNMPPEDVREFVIKESAKRSAK